MLANWPIPYIKTFAWASLLHYVSLAFNQEEALVEAFSIIVKSFG